MPCGRLGNAGVASDAVIAEGAGECRGCREVRGNGPRRMGGADVARRILARHTMAYPILLYQLVLAELPERRSMTQVAVARELEVPYTYPHDRSCCRSARTSR